MGKITDMVQAGFAELGQDETDALLKLDEVAEKMSHMGEAEFAVAVTGLVQARIDKENAETAVAIVKQVVSAAVKLL